MTFSEIKNIEIQEFSTSANCQTYLLKYKDTFFEVGRDVVVLLNCMQKYDVQEDAVAFYQESVNGQYSVQEVDEFLKQLFEKLEPEKSAEVKVKKTKSFLYNHELISASMIEFCTQWLRFLFQKKVMSLVGCIFLALEIYFFTNTMMEISVPRVNLYLIGGLLLFFVFSSLFHEFGHAFACRHFGIKHGSIGFGLYINFPVFYTDVSNIWKLPRGQRCIVNLAGVYFQTILLIPFLVGFMYTYNDFLKYIIYMMNMNFLITLNPFFKFDGYWLMTDLLGVANLRRKGNEYIKYLLKKPFGKPAGQKPYLFFLKKKAKLSLIVYTVVVNCFFAYYFVYLMPMFLLRFCRLFPEQFNLLLRELANHQMPNWVNLQQMFTQLLFLGLTIFMVYRMVKPIIDKLKRT